MSPTDPDAPDAPRLGPEFASRLERLPPGRPARAVVLLAVPPPAGPSPPGRRQDPAARAAALSAVRAAALAHVAQLDALLAAAGGRRLSEPDALGSVLVEAPPATLLALAASPAVRAVLEDQPLAPGATQRPADGTQPDLC